MYIFVQFDNANRNFRDKFQRADDLLKKRSMYKGELAFEIHMPPHYDISQWLNFLLFKEDIASGRPIFMSWNVTKGGTYVLFLNDVTDEKKIQFAREGKQIAKDQDAATRIFIQCPIEFSKLKTDYITTEWMTLLGNKNYFIWNGRIHANIGFSAERA